MKLTILTENTANKRGLLAEHGLSVLVEAGGRRILFDTGQSDVYLKNAEKLGISLQNLDGVVLSHGHYDHCDGLDDGLRVLAAGAAGRDQSVTDSAVSDRDQSVTEGGAGDRDQFGVHAVVLPVYAGQGAFAKKTYTIPGTSRSRKVGISWEREQIRQQSGGAFGFVETDGLTQIFEGIWLLNRIPKLAEFEGVEAGFFTEPRWCAAQKDAASVDSAAAGAEGPGGKVPDTMQDEQMLLIRENGKLHVIAGCCHMGVISCLRYAKQQFPEDRLGIVLAGMHLRSASQERIGQTIEALRAMDFECLVPAHCTGVMGAVAMKMAFGERCALAEAGRVMEG